MTTTTFFFIFIPLLAFILLAVNLIFAPHNPYQEKDSVFERGFHSFLGQNRTQFISFFIFALLFLLFDLEILLVYPYIVSAYTNSTYGLVIMLIFFSVLTIGFVFELGKKALKIDSRQVFSLAKKQQTTAITAVSGFFFFPSGKGKMRDYLALFKGLIKLQYLKLALKKVFSPWPVFIMVMAFIVTVTIRLQLKKYDCDFLFFQSDILFYISSISTIFTGALIRKYFQLFNSIFESIDWSAVYYYFTCSKAERWKVLQDFIKSLEQFHNEKIKLNNFEDSSKDNVSSKKPFNIHDIENTVSPMKKAPSNSLIKASGSGNNNASSSGASNNPNPGRSGDNWPVNKTLNTQIRPGTYILDPFNTARPQQVATTFQSGLDPKLKYLYDLKRAFADKTYNPFQVISRSPSPFSGSIKTLSSEGEQDLATNWMSDARYSDNWNSGLTKLTRIHIFIFLQINASGGISHEVETMKHIIDKMYEEISAPSSNGLVSRVGDTLSERTMYAILTRYPIYQMNNGSVPVEPDLYTFILHIYNTINTICQMTSSDAELFIQHMTILAKTGPYTISQYKTFRADDYKIVAGLVDKYGTDELKSKFANQDNDMNCILTSLSSYGLDIFMAAKQYGILLDIFLNKNKAIFQDYSVFSTGASINMQQYYTAPVVLGKARFNRTDKWLQ